MIIPRPLVWGVRLVVLAGLLILFGNWIRNSGRYLGQHAILLPGFSAKLIADGFNRPSNVTVAPDGRVFLVLQDGNIRIIENDVLLPEPFVFIPTHDDIGEGMFHLTFDPAFGENGYVYIYGVTPEPYRNRLVRVTADGNRALSDSLITVWESPILVAGLDHHGGSPLFDENGLLYLGSGDTTSFTIPRYGSDLTSPFGKILRFTRDGAPAPGNPFSNVPGALPEIYALGFRNPYVLARDPSTGIILVNDVGQQGAEEINQLVAGANYGWGVCEGVCTPPRADLQDPILAYAHDPGPDTGCAVASGVFYHPAQIQFPATYLDQYFYADLCSGWIRTLDLKTKTTTPFALGLVGIEDLDVAPDGSLYYLTRGFDSQVFEPFAPGQLWRIRYTPPR